MRSLILLAVLATFFTGCASVESDEVSEFNNRYGGGADGQIIAFIGDRVEVKQHHNNCPEDQVCMDGMYHARYRVTDVLSGTFDKDEIDFIAYDHYGYPRFAKQEGPIILYVGQYEGALYHQKYQYDVLSSIKGGGYAVCGDPYLHYEDDEIEDYGREDLSVFEFQPPVTVGFENQLTAREDYGEWDQDSIRQEFLDTMRNYAPPIYEFNGWTAVCRMGMRAQKIVDVRMMYDFRPGEKTSAPPKSSAVED